MSQFSVQPLLRTDTLAIRDVVCDGTCRHISAEECTAATISSSRIAASTCATSATTMPWPKPTRCCSSTPARATGSAIPSPGGDACLALVIDEPLVRELAPNGLAARRRDRWPFASSACASTAGPGAGGAAAAQPAPQRRRDRWRRKPWPSPWCGAPWASAPSHAAGASPGRQKLVDRAKLVLAGDLARRWTLAEIAAEVGGSPVYLTQVFQQVEGDAALSLPAPPAAGARAGPARPVRRPHRARAWTSASPATAISAPPSGRPTAARPRSSSARSALRR